jgi:hypothetical protein
MSRRPDRRSSIQVIPAAIVALSAGGCSLLIGSELSGKPEQATGAGGGGGEAASTTGAGGKPAGNGGSNGTASSTSSGAMCPMFTADCDGNPMHACTTNLKNDPKNCGACGVVCMPPGGCVEGKCK